MGGGEQSSNPKICATLVAETVEEMVSDMHRAKEQGADVVEIRLDCIKNLQSHRDLKTILTNKPLPVIIVYRQKWDGAHCEGYEKIMSEALHLAHQLGADYVDLELEVASGLVAELKRKNFAGSKIIVSSYLSGATPSKEKLSILAAEMEATGADMIKIVSNAKDITEMDRIFHLLSHSEVEVPTVAYSEGERGLISQLLSPKFGGALVYGSLEGNSISGLPSLDSLREAYKVKYINSDTKVFGLISKPVSHSKGPILHNPTFRHMNYNGTYVPMFVDDLKEFFNVYSSTEFAGFSVGIPYKEAAIEFCDEVHPLAKSIGAVNTIIRRHDGKLFGYNTDCEASITAIEDAIKEHKYPDVNASLINSPLDGKQFVVVGAGGAGRAIAIGAKSRGARVIIFDIDFGRYTLLLSFNLIHVWLVLDEIEQVVCNPSFLSLVFIRKERAKSLAVAASGEAQPFESLSHFQPEIGAILANATPIGMHPNTDRIPVAEATLGNYLLVFDAVYTPRKTRLLKDAAAAGAIVVSGVEMFLRQAIGQCKLFTGGEAPEDFMREIVLERF